MNNYLIIGGSSGIGKEIVSKLESEESEIWSTYNSTPVESRTRVNYQKLDVLTDTLDISALPEEIHGLAYCPGSVNLKPFHRFKEDDFMADFKLQVLGATNIIKQLMPKLKNSGNASIVLFSTIAVQNGFNFHTQVAISKGAIEGLTRSLSAELAPSIRVNAIAPSLTNTPLVSRILSSPEKEKMYADKNPLKKLGSASAVADAATFLLTDRSSWITGQVMHVDGGASTIKS